MHSNSENKNHGNVDCTKLTERFGVHNIKAIYIYCFLVDTKLTTELTIPRSLAKWLAWPERGGFYNICNGVDFLCTTERSIGLRWSRQSGIFFIHSTRANTSNHAEECVWSWLGLPERSGIKIGFVFVLWRSTVCTWEVCDGAQCTVAVGRKVFAIGTWYETMIGGLSGRVVCLIEVTDLFVVGG